MIKEKLIELTAGFLGGVFLSYAEDAADVLSNAAVIPLKVLLQAARQLKNGLK